MNPLAIAAQGKGVRGMFKRAATIQGHYGATTAKMDRLLTQFADLLHEYAACATFPITAVVMLRNKGIIEKYQGRSIEFAVHGYYHIDQSRLSFEKQYEQFQRARELAQARGIECFGFRSPYLRSNEQTLSAIRQAGYLYDSSQGLTWDVASHVETPAYRHVLGFYDTVPASVYPSLPRADRGLIRIPYCLPDDEAFIDRFGFKDDKPMSDVWKSLWRATYERGELCTLGLHPERLALCGQALRETLQFAHERKPRVWFARLDEIARWWQARTDASVSISEYQNQEFKIDVKGPPGTTLLARNVILMSPSAYWDETYCRIEGNSVCVKSSKRPFIGLSARSASYLGSFLRQQGYIVEITEDKRMHSLWFDRPEFTYEDERAVLTEIEGSTVPLVRLGRWFDGAKSALCVTGDIDALTVWDYGLRILGK